VLPRTGAPVTVNRLIAQTASVAEATAACVDACQARYEAAGGLGNVLDTLQYSLDSVKTAPACQLRLTRLNRRATAVAELGLEASDEALRKLASAANNASAACKEYSLPLRR
jgi:hypothetical protein